ncbi:hypothetical protein HAX54_043255 [Datura stramonium]|uniref:Uncharacterized protein n=1 Tax=Datura stramonium TaxID=4076 RepID=A0ABS8SNA4_DATST|nr:hypothetical protein [Datura stramonium]
MNSWDKGNNQSESKPFELYKRRTTVIVKRETFLDVVCDALTEYKYMGPNQRADLILACRIRERKESVTVLLCGTSGYEKAKPFTLGFNLPCWVEYLDPVAVSEAKASSSNKKLAGISTPPIQKEGVRSPPVGISSAVDLISAREMAVEGFKAEADKHLVPKINNTNVDKSVAAIHATVFGCLRRREAGEQLYDPIKNTVAVIDEEYRNQCAAKLCELKGMFQLIQRKGSSRHLMALLNNDGSVAKAWPVYTLGNDGKLIKNYSIASGIGTSMYGPLQICKAELC